MLTLYSFGPGANSLKPLLTLYEKGLEFKSVFLNPGKFEHHSDWFKKINPNGQVPVLDHDGRIVTESTVICEYLEDELPTSPPLRSLVTGASRSASESAQPASPRAPIRPGVGGAGGDSASDGGPNAGPSPAFGSVVSEGSRWPSSCKSNFSPQERLLEYLFFNIASCVQGPG